MGFWYINPIGYTQNYKKLFCLLEYKEQSIEAECHTDNLGWLKRQIETDCMNRLMKQKLVFDFNPIIQAQSKQ